MFGGLKAQAGTSHHHEKGAMRLHLCNFKAIQVVRGVVRGHHHNNLKCPSQEC